MIKNRFFLLMSIGWIILTAAGCQTLSEQEASGRIINSFPENTSVFASADWLENEDIVVELLQDSSLNLDDYSYILDKTDRFYAGVLNSETPSSLVPGISGDLILICQGNYSRELIDLGLHFVPGWSQVSVAPVLWKHKTASLYITAPKPYMVILSTLPPVSFLPDYQEQTVALSSKDQQLLQSEDLYLFVRDIQNSPIDALNFEGFRFPLESMGLSLNWEAELARISGEIVMEDENQAKLSTALLKIFLVGLVRSETGMNITKQMKEADIGPEGKSVLVDQLVLDRELILSVLKGFSEQEVE